MYGRNRILKKVREFPILGGSGAFEFEFARGHAQAETYKLNGFDVMVEYNKENKKTKTNIMMNVELFNNKNPTLIFSARPVPVQLWEKDHE
ncbi:hypothetical protein YC2023_023306 [Brassica napus]